MDTESGLNDTEEDYFEPKYSDKKQQEKPKKKIKKQKRPKTAKVPPVLYTPTGKQKKTDRLKVFLSRKQEWDSHIFLKANSLSTKEGRKLNFGRRLYGKTFEIIKRTSVHDFRTLAFVPPHEKRRDSLRRLIRMKMIKSYSSLGG